MTRAALIVLTLAIAAPARADCPPATSLRGPRGLVSKVSAMLAERALVVGAAGPCGVIEVELRVAGDAIVVIGDGETRMVSDASAAATLIESWARVDLARPLLAARQVSAPAPAREPAAIETRAPEPLPAPVAPGNVLALAAAAELGVGIDGSTWSGVAINGCAHVSAICIGVLARLARDNQINGDAARLEGSRTGLDILLTVEASWRRGDWRLRPGFGIGQGVVYAKIINNGKLDDEEGAAVLLRGRVGLGYQISEHWSIEADPAVVYGLGADKIVHDFEEDGSVVPYPGDPGLHIRLGLGVRVETL